MARCPRRQPCCMLRPAKAPRRPNKNVHRGPGATPPLWPPGALWYFLAREKVQPCTKTLLQENCSAAGEHSSPLHMNVEHLERGYDPTSMPQRLRLPKRLDIPKAGERSWGGALPAPPTLLYASPREGSTQAKRRCAPGSGGHTSIVAPGRLLVLFAETKRTPLHLSTVGRNHNASGDHRSPLQVHGKASGAA